MILKNFPTGIESDDSTLLQYEALRSQALDRQEIFSERSLGMTLFMRRGMLAWIEVCHRYTPPANANTKKPTQTPVLAYRATSEMIKIMANITLCNLEDALS